MGNKASFMLQDEEIKLISEETGFSPAQIERLYSRFTALDKGCNGSLSCQDCLAIPELAINPLCDRIVHMFFIDCDADHERINFRQFMRVLATFRSSHHKSSPLSRSHNVSRQESLNQQTLQSIMKHAPLLFDTIDPTSLSALSKHHSRHSSFQDAFHHHDGVGGHHHNHHPHHHHHRHHSSTNQHSFHYASNTHLHSNTNGHHHLISNSLSSEGSLNLNGTAGINNNNDNLAPYKKHVQLPLVNLDEPPNSQKHKLYFMFKIYDVNEDNLVDLEDLVAILKLMVGTYVDEARVRRIAERTLRDADKDCDGAIDFEEFCAAFSCKDIEESLRINFRLHLE